MRGAAESIAALLGALLATEIIEIPLGLALIRKKDAALPLFLVNLLTNPLLNAALRLVLAGTEGMEAAAAGPIYLASLILGEIAVVVTEAFLLRRLCRLKTGRAFAVSLILNVTSFALGLMIQML